MENQFVHENEKTYYTVCLIVSILIYIGLILSIVGIIYIIGGIIVTLFLHGISIGHIRNNGVKLTERQFPDIHARVKKIAFDMGISNPPDIFIMQSGGLLNAFATAFFGRNFIVLYSEIAEIEVDGNEEELNFIIAHELAHIKRNHITKHLFITPALWIPFLGNAYSRACEYTCDRIAATYTDNPESAINALGVLAVGKRLFLDMDMEEYIQTARTEKGFFVKLSLLLSTHPPLPKRMEEIQHFSNVMKAIRVLRVGM